MPLLRRQPSRNDTAKGGAAMTRRGFAVSGLAGVALIGSGCSIERPKWLEPEGKDDLPVLSAAATLCSQLAVAAAARPAVAAMHQAHLSALQSAARQPIAIPAIALAPGPLLPIEQSAITQLDALALKAHDGGLARLIAEISAAISQRLGGMQ